MDDLVPFAHAILLVAAVCVLAVGSNRLAERLRVPAPALFLIVAAVAADVLPRLGELPIVTDQRIVTVALALILFDGGMHIGWDRMRPALAGVAWLGVAGTVVDHRGTRRSGAHCLRFRVGGVLLIGAALAPTDRRWCSRCSGGARSRAARAPCWRASQARTTPSASPSMVSLLGCQRRRVGRRRPRRVALRPPDGGRAAVGVWAVAGVAAADAAGAVAQRGSVPGADCGLRTGAIYGLATRLEGSGFLAVFIAGVMVGDQRAPYKREIEQFAGALAGLAEIVAFVVLGLSVNLEGIVHDDRLGGRRAGGPADPGGAAGAWSGWSCCPSG